MLHPCDIRSILRHKSKNVICCIHDDKTYELTDYVNLLNSYVDLDPKKHSMKIVSILYGDHIIGDTWWMRFACIRDTEMGWCYYEHKRKKIK